MYKLINENNTIVKDYPSSEIYKTMSDGEKKNIFTFKNEIEKITLKKGLGRVSVYVSYDGPNLEKGFMINYSNGFTKEYYETEIENINKSLKNFSKKNNIYDTFLNSHIILND